MDKLVINGGNKLFGEVNISGAKNAALPIIAATALVEGRCVIENVPNIKDVDVLLEILRLLGANVKYNRGGVIDIDCSRLDKSCAVEPIVRKMRASYYLLGVLLARFHSADVALPGGCDFGGRPIDQHIKGFEILGAKTTVEHGIVSSRAEDGLWGDSVYLDVVSVGATINIMLCAVMAEGMTVIDNAAKEPHVVDLANFLNSMGAKIKGAGTDTIRVTGVKSLHGCTYSIIPDQIEAGTFMVATAACGGNVLVKNVIPKHLDAITAKLVEMKVGIREYDDSVRVYRDGTPIHKVNIKTLPYPGFPTDMQPLAVMLLTIAEGTSIVREDVWESRFQYVDQLQHMGANIKVNGKTAVIEGVKQLSGCPVRSTDLRAGAAMLIAGLIAKGTTELYNLTHIDRGYENFESKLRVLGADITRVNDVEDLLC